MLSQYGPDLLVQCENANTMSEELVGAWLKNFMFKGKHEKVALADEIAGWLANHKHFKSHSRHISRFDLETKGLEIEHLEQDEATQDLVLSVFHATTHTFGSTRAVKIIENQFGKAFIKQVQAMLVPVSTPPGATVKENPPVKKQT